MDGEISSACWAASGIVPLPGRRTLSSRTPVGTSRPPEECGRHADLELMKEQGTIEKIVVVGVS